MAARLEYYQRADEDFGWRLIAGNGEVQASGEGHPTKYGARRAAFNTAANMAEAIASEIEEARDGYRQAVGQLEELEREAGANG